MSELYDDDLADLPPRASRRTKVLIGLAVALVLLFFGVTTFASIYTDGLWYHSVDYGSVFSRLFWTKGLLFVVFGLVMGLSLVAAMVLAFRSRPFYHPADEHSGVARYRDAIHPIRGWLMAGVCVIAGAFAGVSAAGQWRTFMLWRHGVPFGQRDPYFGKDIGFYVFSLPWWHYLVNFGLTTLVLALLASLLVHYLYGGIRLSSPAERFAGPAQVQLSILVGLLVLFKAVDYWLDRYDLVHSDSPLFTGVGYTDDHAVLPGKNILAGVALVCALLFFVNAWRRSWLMPTVAVSLLLVSAVLLGLIWPAIVQGFQVKPSQSDKERSYLADNIAATRTAYGIDSTHVKTEKYVATSSGAASTTKGLRAQAKSIDAQASSASVLDPTLAASQFEQTQQGKSFYTMTNPLDTDHYTIQGRDRALLLGVRELDQSGLDASDQTWTNLHTVYTHGDGIVAAYANQRGVDNTTEATGTQYADGASGANTYRDLETAEGGFEHRIYYGEDAPSYSVVGKPAGAPSVELDTALNSKSGLEEQPQTTYAGKGGVSIGSTFRRLMYAVNFGSTNFLLSERVNDSSKVLYNRTPLEAVSKVAPWLTLDSDVYPVIYDHRILWVVDGYTTTDDYPGSERTSFASMTDDAAQQTEGQQTLPTDQINYMRNAVKATVDAYDGTVTLYAWDESDPMLQAWMSAFPGTVQDTSTIPPGLKAHFRYPEDLFKVQRYQLARYHVTDPTAFLDGSQRWEVPPDPNNTGHLVTPYRSLLDDPSAGASTGASSTPLWSLTSTLVPYQRNNLAAIMTVDSDGSSSDYGTIRVLQGFDQQTGGPGQVSSNLHTDPGISSEIASFNRASAVVSYGNLIALPTARDGLLWVEPVYATQTGGSPTSYSVLSDLLVAYDGKYGYGPTLEAAIYSALTSHSSSSAGSGNTPPGEPSGGSSTSPPSSSSSDDQAARLLKQAQQLFAKAKQASKAGAYSQAAAWQAQAEAKVAKASQLLQARSRSTSGSSPRSAPTVGSGLPSPPSPPSVPSPPSAPGSSPTA